MEAKEVQNVCRLCPANQLEETLLNVFDEHFGKKNLSEIIFLTTGIKISESDIVSKKICRKCYESTQNINNIRQVALQQDQRLKEKCKEYLQDKGIKLPNSCIIIRKSNADTVEQVLRESDGNSFSIIGKDFSDFKQNPMKKRSIKGVTHLHPSVINLYRKYPKYKLTKKCLDKDITPVVTLCMGQVESYYKRQKLNMNDFIYNPEKPAHKLTSIIRNVARKKTTVPSKTIAQLKLLRTSHKPSHHSIKQTTFGKNLPMYSAIPITSVVEKDHDNSAGTSAVESQKLTLLLKRSHKNVMDDEALMSIDDGLNIIENFDSNSKDIGEQEIVEAISSNSDALNASKPNFIQSLGLTPSAMLAAGCNSPVSFECTICKSTHPNEAALQKHHSRHRICPYCRLKFRTVEIKNNHIENNCTLVGQPGLIPEDKSEDGKKKSKESPLMDDVDKITNTVNKENVISLTDDDDSQATDDIMEIDVINNTANIESESLSFPKISICNNGILDQVQNNLTETVFMKKLLLLLKKQNFVETREVQACRVNEEKTIAIQDRTCRFTNFSHNFYSYMVPMRFKHGEFTVSFDQTKNLAITTNQWKDISVIVDERKPLSQSQEVSLVNATYPVTFVTSHVPSAQLSLPSIQVMAAPTMSILLPNTSSFLGTNVTHDQNQSNIGNTFFNALGNNSIQTTPLLQNYTLSMTPLPIINNPVIPVQAASNINITVAEKTSSGSENTGSSSSSVSSDGPSTSSRAYAGSSRKLERSSLRRNRRFTNFKAGERKIRSSRSSKLRVKNIWELK